MLPAHPGGAAGTHGISEHPPPHVPCPQAACCPPSSCASALSCYKPVLLSHLLSPAKPGAERGPGERLRALFVLR